ncbi:hypothetical protein RSOLAG22IIIB_08311 [Rhizoctonia solani]|uniref:F-box domain-containing protein n=1 Tax=Rhizoctonia solani TaxID=456999 RepID=A0A0K6FT50_9AGAM|nr:hypothetical protein RSOLAG22IIIB_08311 [Rhizoctonia solani]
MNSTPGYFSYRYQGIYYQKFLTCGAQLSEYGQKLANSIPRDPSTFQGWANDKIRMLEETKASIEENQCPDERIHDFTGGYELRDGYTWTLDHHGTGRRIKWTYVIDLDNLIFTINQFLHLRLDNMPPSNLSLDLCWGEPIRFRSQCIAYKFDLWPHVLFNIEERQQSYNALNPVILAPEKWGAPTWNELTMAQLFSVARSSFFLRNTSKEMYQAYTIKYRARTGRFCWDLVCAATPGVPLLRYNDKPAEKIVASRNEGNTPDAMVEKTGAQGFKCFEASNCCDYCWVRGCLVTFCVQLSQQGQVVHEIEQMVQKMHHDGQAECIGIILSSQREMIVVAVDNGLEPVRQVRHTPVLKILPSANQPGKASKGLLLLVHLLSPVPSIAQLPWRAPQPRQPDLLPPRKQLLTEVLQHIIHYTDTETYLNLCKVSKSIREICLRNPRVGEYTILRELPGGNLSFAARHTGDETSRILKLRWIRCPRFRIPGY